MATLKMIPANKVSIGMVAKDYNDEIVGKVMQIVPAKDWKDIKHLSASGWMDDRSIKDSVQPNDYLVVVKGPELGYFGGPGTEVWVYGYEGAYCET